MNTLVVVGSGIAGLAHAWAAHEAGWQVTVLERSARPLGASVRNFGLIWPIGQPRGPWRDNALRSLVRWRERSRKAGFWFAQTGSVYLAYVEEGREVLDEYHAAAPADERLERWAPDEVCARIPAVRPAGLLGGLFSPHEAAVYPAEAIYQLGAWLGEKGVVFHYRAPVVSVENHQACVSDGRRFPFDRLVACCGDEVDLLYPAALRAASGVRCKLQMMRTVPQPASWRITPAVAADLTLCHYTAFAACPTYEALRRWMRHTLPDYDAWGIHVLAAQKPDGALFLGDSHEYGDAFAPGSRMDIDRAVLRYLQSFLTVPDLTIATRWTGTYLKAVNDAVLVSSPEPDVQVITGLGGGGMTLSFALAEEIVAAW